jgi:cellulose synthase operon protein YhjQ
MDTRGINLENEAPATDTPEDVAILYSWANLQGAKYRDFSGSRREYRAQIRHRAARALQEKELKAAAEAEAAAEAAEQAARAAEAAARHADPNDSQMRRLQILRQAEAAARRAAADRMEAAHRAEAAALAEAAARREEAEMAEAHASSQRQAAAYAESDIRRQRLAGPQPRSAYPVEMTDPYVRSNEAADEEAEARTAASRQILPSEPFRQPSPILQREPIRLPGDSAIRHSARSPMYEGPPKRRPQGYHPDEASGVWQIKRVANGEFVPGPPSRNLVPVRDWMTPDQLREANAAGEETNIPEAEIVSQPHLLTEGSPVRPSEPEPFGNASEPFGSVSHLPPAPSFSAEAPLDPPPDRPISRETVDIAASASETASAAAPDIEPLGPAWLFAPQTPSRPRTRPASSSSSGYRIAALRQSAVAGAAGAAAAGAAGTLQDSAERVASRWFALKGVFEHPAPGTAETPAHPAAILPIRPSETQAPLLVVFSLAGGVGKTSLVATLGRAFSSMGEKVLLTDTTSHGLLPFYFGARELRSGVVRTFSPPSGSTDAPIHLVSYDVGGKSGDSVAQQQLADEILTSGPGNNRILLDLSPSAAWLVGKIANLHPTVLVPVSPDMNSVISLQAVEKLFQSATDDEGHSLQPFYVLNQFDSSLALHLDVREVFRRQLGERLLPFVIRRSPAVSEALAEGMTVVDYAPDAPVSQDYLDIASWLRSVSPPASASFRNVRWSER